MEKGVWTGILPAIPVNKEGCLPFQEIRIKTSATAATHLPTLRENQDREIRKYYMLWVLALDS